jgi:hypothetical protein
MAASNCSQGQKASQEGLEKAVCEAKVVKVLIQKLPSTMDVLKKQQMG